jgi:alkylhydroperoxidase family enzyme
MMPDPAPRMPKVTQEQWTDAVLEVFDVMTGPGFNADNSKHHVVTTFAQHPALATPFFRFNRQLLADNTMPVRLRQIAIMRTAWVRRCVYMWSSHLRMSIGLGLGREEFEAIKAGAVSPYWSEFERVLVAAVDQLCARSDMDQATWDALSAEFDHKQMLDLLFTVGAYTMIAMPMNAIRIDREEELIQYAAEYGAPDPL